LSYSSKADINAALSGLKLLVLMRSVAKRNPLFLFRLSALLGILLNR
jgi:hypothetical protein